MKKRFGFTFVEISLVLFVTAISLSMAVPLYSKGVADARFQRFARELTGFFLLARNRAQITGVPVALDFESDRDFRFACYQEEHDAWQLISGSAWEGREILNQLPAYPLKKPNGSGNLDQALSSVHAPRIIFGEQGSGGGTVVFSDREGRVICAIVSGQSGRFRIYIKYSEVEPWRVFY